MAPRANPASAALCAHHAGSWARLEQLREYRERQLGSKECVRAAAGRAHCG